MADHILTAEKAREIFDYNPETGIFTRKKGRFASKIGIPVGARHSKGYVDIRYYEGGAEFRCYAHRLAWLYVTGEWPKGQIDHINGVRHDNRFCNLRDVTQTINMLNQRRPQKDNAIGFLGVNRISRSNKFVASVNYEGRRIALGYFSRPEDAHNTYMKAKRLISESNHTKSTVNFVFSKDLKPDARGRLINLLL